VDAVVAHLGRDGFVGDAETAAEAATFVGPVDLDQFQPSDLSQQIAGLREVRLVDQFGRPGVAESPDGGATVVQADLVGERRLGEAIDLQVVVQELDEFPRAGTDLADLGRLFDRVEVEADVVDAAPGRPDDRVELLEALDEVGFGGGGIFLATAVGHRLPAAGLLERILDRAAEPFEEFQGCDAYFREKGVDVTGNEKSDLHRPVPPLLIPPGDRMPASPSVSRAASVKAMERR
jgi:hypothetical protein